MGRFLRASLLIGGVASGYFAVRYALAWRQERQRQNVFPAAEASTLLNPMRPVIMPAGRTLDRFGVSSGGIVLEVGPGPGYYSIEASRRVGAAGRLICLDLQRDMIVLLRARLAEAATSAETGVADATRLPVKDDSIDVAFLVTVLGEVPEPEAALAEMRRVLKPGGTLGLGETMGDPDYIRLGKLREMCGRAGFVEATCHHDVLGYTITFSAP
ncbi:MAG TPA: methyltransferase domain-containing protein [Dehalococcoidia bacterium]